jgi:hypothetical protein
MVTRKNCDKVIYLCHKVKCVEAYGLLKKKKKDLQPKGSVRDRKKRMDSRVQNWQTLCFNSG